MRAAGLGLGTCLPAAMKGFLAASGVAAMKGLAPGGSGGAFVAAAAGLGVPKVPKGLFAAPPAAARMKGFTAAAAGGSAGVSAAGSAGARSTLRPFRGIPR